MNPSGPTDGSGVSGRARFASLVDDAMAWQRQSSLTRKASPPIVVVTPPPPLDPGLNPTPRARALDALRSASLIALCLLAVGVVWLLGAVLARESSQLHVTSAPRAIRNPRVISTTAVPAASGAVPVVDGVATPRALASPATLPPGRLEM